MYKCCSIGILYLRSFSINREGELLTTLRLHVLEESLPLQVNNVLLLEVVNPALDALGLELLLLLGALLLYNAGILILERVQHVVLLQAVEVLVTGVPAHLTLRAVWRNSSSVGR